MLNQKSLLLSLAVLTAFILSATSCGKSKESRSDVRGETVTQQGEVQQDQQDLDLADDQGLNGAPLPPAGPVSQTTVVEGVKLLPKSAESQNGGGAGVGGLNPLPVSNGNGSAGELPQAGKNKKQNGAVIANFDVTSVEQTGGKLDKLNYTAASADGLMAEFRSYNNSVAAAQKQMNLNLAKAVIGAKLIRSAGSMTVDLTLDESIDGVKKISSYRLQGVSSDAGDRQILKKSSANGDLEYQGGFLKCTDKDGGCDNAYIKIKLSGAYLRVIFRNSYADRFFILEEGSQGSAFEMWKSYLSNTTNGSTTSQKIAYVQTSSYEIVNGRSGMGIKIATEDNETVGLSVPLLAPDNGTLSYVGASKVTDLSRNYDLTSNLNGPQNLAQTIKEAKLVNNNGKGEVRVRLDVSAGAAKAGVWLTTSRLQKATLSNAEISSFESKIPKF